MAPPAGAPHRRSGAGLPGRQGRAALPPPAPGPFVPTCFGSAAGRHGDVLLADGEATSSATRPSRSTAGSGTRAAGSTRTSTSSTACSRCTPTRTSGRTTATPPGCRSTDGEILVLDYTNRGDPLRPVPHRGLPAARGRFSDRRAARERAGEGQVDAGVPADAEPGGGAGAGADGLAVGGAVHQEPGRGGPAGRAAAGGLRGRGQPLGGGDDPADPDRKRRQRGDVVAGGGDRGIGSVCPRACTG